MRIAGITWWRYNYGSILQAYALQQELNKKENIDYEILCQYGKKVTSASNLKEKLKRIGLIKTIKRVFWKFGLKKLRKRNTNIQNFIDKNLKISDREYTKSNIKDANNVYDGFICGSDQIWNPKLTSLESIYWLSFANKEKLKVAYAPSIGVSILSNEQKKKIKENLKSFNAISTREKQGTDLINSVIGNKKCITVLDPTLLTERNLWDKISSNNNIYNTKYIFVYMLRGTKNQRKLIEKYAQNKKMKIVTMPFLDNEKISLYDFKFGDIKVWDASPADFITVIRNAEYVFTDSFHCMLFSTMYHKSFYTFPKIGKSQVNRMLDFQKLISAENRMINDNSTIEEIENIDSIDWDKVDETIKNRRKESKKYLDDAFSIK